MAESNNKRNWLLVIAIAAMMVMLWDNNSFLNGGLNLFHFHWNIPVWPILIVLFAIWWMTGGKERARGCDCGWGCDCGCACDCGWGCDCGCDSDGTCECESQDCCSENADTSKDSAVYPANEDEESDNNA